jgi:hypothetical protein
MGERGEQRESKKKGANRKNRLSFSFSISLYITLRGRGMIARYEGDVN